MRPLPSPRAQASIDSSIAGVNLADIRVKLGSIGTSTAGFDFSIRWGSKPMAALMLLPVACAELASAVATLCSCSSTDLDNLKAALQNAVVPQAFLDKLTQAQDGVNEAKSRLTVVGTQLDVRLHFSTATAVHAM
jgi:hypothetical protein